MTHTTKRRWAYRRHQLALSVHDIIHCHGREPLNRLQWRTRWKHDIAREGGERAWDRLKDHLREFEVPCDWIESHGDYGRLLLRFGHAAAEWVAAIFHEKDTLEEAICRQLSEGKPPASVAAEFGLKTSVVNRIRQERAA